jgi:hypothetical protein
MLKLTLQNIEHIDPDQAHGTTIFYFTDNTRPIALPRRARRPVPACMH